MITKLQFCHDVSVSDVGDLVKVILASVIIYCFDFTVGSHFVALIRIYCSLSLACKPPPPPNPCVLCAHFDRFFFGVCQ